MILVKLDPTFESFRTKARQLLSKEIHPRDIEWLTEDSGFTFGEWWEDIPVIASAPVPKEYVELANLVSTLRDPTVWTLLYRVLYRITYEDRALLQSPLDSDVLDLAQKAKLVTRDMHKMKAFVRFKEVRSEEGTLYVAWHRPDHRIVRLVAPFFKDRFNGMNWIIMTEDESVSWDGKELRFSEGVPKEKVNIVDSAEDLWKTYYSSIFNPARIKISAMKKELPVRHWKTLPETELITGLLQEAPGRLQEFYDSQTLKPTALVDTLEELNEELKRCRACGICPKATGPVPGEGPRNAKIMLIGEQPGNEEDLARKPFIGPAGGVLDRALKENGIRREDLYITNAVKGFKYIPKGHQRWHKGASLAEVTTCKSWLKKEIELVKPEVVVCLGRSAALAITGKMVKIKDVRGEFFESAFSKKTIILPHPAAILRNADEPIEEFIREMGKLQV